MVARPQVVQRPPRPPTQPRLRSPPRAHYGTNQPPPDPPHPCPSCLGPERPSTRGHQPATAALSAAKLAPRPASGTRRRTRPHPPDRRAQGWPRLAQRPAGCGRGRGYVAADLFGETMASESSSPATVCLGPRDTSQPWSSIAVHSAESYGSPTPGARTRAGERGRPARARAPLAALPDRRQLEVHVSPLQPDPPEQSDSSVTPRGPHADDDSSVPPGSAGTLRANLRGSGAWAAPEHTTWPRSSLRPRVQAKLAAAATRGDGPEAYGGRARSARALPAGGATNRRRAGHGPDPCVGWIPAGYPVAEEVGGPELPSSCSTGERRRPRPRPGCRRPGAGDGGRLRQGAGAVRKADRLVPGGQAPLCRHAGRRRGHAPDRLPRRLVAGRR